MQQMPEPQPPPTGQPAYSPHAVAPGPMSGAGVAHQITHGPSFAMLRVDLSPGQTLVAEAQKRPT